MIPLHFIFSSLLLISSIFVLFSKNPVHSVLFLILAFCNASGILFLFNAEFLGLIFIIIYVGAIAILFLFVVMMLNVKIYASNNFLIYLPFFLIGGFILLLQIFLVFERIFSNSEIYLTTTFYSFENYLDNLSSIDLLGQSLYNYYLICFLLAGFILLIAMVGAIVLTLKFNGKRKNELASRQLSRTNNFLAFFKTY
jgi:NADH-quinone oxidoreductase subunit J